MQDIATKVEGSQLTAEEFNQIPSELENVITSTGQSLSASDLRQLAKAIAIYSGLGDFYNTSGTVNNITLNPVGSLQAPSAYTKGLQIRFIPTANNTSTVNINIAGLSSVKLLDDAGNTLQANRLSANAIYSATFNGTDFILSGVVDASLVHKTGNETISGIKTFIDNITAPNQKQIAFENMRVVECSGSVTVTLQNTDEVIRLNITDAATVSFDVSALTFLKTVYTVQIYVVFPNGAKTISLSATPSILWLNNTVPNFSSTKPHWLVLRFLPNDSFVLISDAGEAG